jgi:Chaperone of endosialidase
MKTKSVLLALAFAATAMHAQNAVPTLMNFQSTVTDANGVRIGNTAPENRDITLRIYDAAQGGTIIYSEHQIATIANGDFSLLLGAGDAVGAEPHGSLQAAFSGPTRYLGITVDDGTVAADVEISPRQQIVSTAFAFAAQTAQSVPAANVLSAINANGLTTAGTRLGVNAPDIASQPPAGTYRLTVRGDNTDPGALANQIVVQSEGNSGQRKLFMGVNNAGNYGSIQAYDEGGVGPNKLVLNPAGGSVGIGTTSPQARLHVQGISPFSTLALQAAPAGASTWADQIFYNRGGGINAAFQMIGSNGDIMAGTQAGDFFTRSTNRLFLQSGITSGPGVGITISADNKIGMNTTTPSAQLDVFANGSAAAIFNNGNVGIGVSAAEATNPLTVRGAGNQLSLKSAAGNVAVDFSVSNTGGTGGGPSASIQSNNGFGSLTLNPSGGNVGIGIADAPARLTIKGGGPQLRIVSPTNNAHALELAALTTGGSNQNTTTTLQAAGGTSNTLTLNPNGGPVNIGGLDNAGFGFQVNGSMNVQLGAAAGVSAHADYGLQAAGEDRKQLRITRPGVGSWDIFVNGGNVLYFRNGVTGIDPNINPNTGAFSQSSDSRLKKDIEPMTHLLSKVMKLRPVSYRFNQMDGSMNKSMGFLAQDVEPLFPGVVSQSGTGYKSMAYSELIPVAIGAVQEVNVETNKLKEENATLKTQLNGLEERLKKLEALLEKQAASGEKAD